MDDLTRSSATAPAQRSTSSPTNVDILDVHIAATLTEPPAALGRLQELIAAAQHPDLTPPFSLSTTLVVDQAARAVPATQVESVRSQVRLMVSTARIEVHDLSGSWERSRGRLPELITWLAGALEVSQISALNFSIELTRAIGGQGRAARAIAETLITPNLDYLNQRGGLAGAGAKLFFQEPDGLYALSLEPRYNDLATDTLWVAAVKAVPADRMPQADDLRQTLSSTYGLIERITERVLSGDAPQP